MAPESRRPAFPARLQSGAGQGDATPPHGRGRRPARTAPARPDYRPAANGVPARARMVQQLARDGIRDPRVLQAMGTVDRHRFVDEAFSARAYEDAALPIGLGQTISAPGIVARMLELLLQSPLGVASERLGRVLDIGTGCGYQALLLSQLATEVYSIERLRALHAGAKDNLRALRVPNIHLILGDGMLGFPEGAPYAGIIAAAGGAQIPPAWIDQLAEGGRIVAPVACPGQAGQALVVIDKSAAGVQRTVLEAVRFVPLKSGIA